MPVTVMVGARAYPLDDGAARWLAVEILRGYFSDLDDPPVSEHALRLADAIELVLTERPGEPIELGHWEVEALSIALLDRLVVGDPALEALYDAIRRFRGDPPEARFGR